MLFKVTVTDDKDELHLDYISLEDLEIDEIDWLFLDIEDRKMIEHLATAKYKPMTDFYRGKWGLPQSQTQIISDSYSDLLQIKRQGGFKAHYILGLEQLMKHMKLH